MLNKHHIGMVNALKTEHELHNLKEDMYARDCMHESSRLSIPVTSSTPMTQICPFTFSTIHSYPSSCQQEDTLKQAVFRHIPSDQLAILKNFMEGALLAGKCM